MVFEISDIKFVKLKDLNYYFKSEEFINKIKNNYKFIKSLYN